MSRDTMSGMLTLPAMKRLVRPETPRLTGRITARDYAIMRAVARYRLMTSDQIHAYLANSEPLTSAQHVRRRLQFLFCQSAPNFDPRPNCNLDPFRPWSFRLPSPELWSVSGTA